ncbi:hypothetical protein BN873_p10002 [Candidatus Competibacter denitrificans Run_A_D11]|uniref:Uncharacterized protein n=1 Tax=Candidatus Competibacter denitrificans Run_A_D11 TaxID=1400863 RepID=W6MEG2_9GAMM|nr:hypothetical protein BN873_p10002 [Candidatus Competibacter denitrificans Run_A_D11]
MVVGVAPTFGDESWGTCLDSLKEDFWYHYEAIIHYNATYFAKFTKNLFYDESKLYRQKITQA